MKPVTVILALVVAGLVLAGAVILSATGPRAAARTPQGSAATNAGNGCTATTPSTLASPLTAAGLADDQSRAPTRQSALTSICGPVTVTSLGEQPSTPDRSLLTLSTHQVLLNPAGSIIGQQMLEQTRRILRGPDGRWLVDVQVRAG